ncbi:MAG: Npt1/Npt2 family nucleotide transporter [Deltaproteobacteria bacterium]
MEIGHATPPEPGFLGWLHKIFPIKRSEALTVTLLAINTFTLMTCYYVLKVVREPLIIEAGGAKLKSYMSGIQTLLLIAIVPAFGWLSGRVSRIRLMTIMQLIFIGCLVGFEVMLQSGARIGVVFYVWVGIFNVMVVSNFWSFANDLYTENEGKRLFALIGFGASIGAIVGAFLPHFLQATLGLHGLMLISVGALVFSIFLYRIVDRRERARKQEVVAEKQKKKPGAASAVDGDKRGGFALVLRDRYLRILALMLLVATVINTTGEYVISKMAEDRGKAYAAKMVQESVAGPDQPAAAPDAAKADPAKLVVPKPEAAKADASDADKAVAKKAEDEYLGKFFSDYYGLVNLIAALLQGLVVTRLLVAFGVRKSLFIMPVIVFGGWLALVMFVNLAIVRVEKTTENSLDYSLNNTLRQALFLPTSPQAKYKAKAAIDTFVFRMGDAIAGLGIVALFVEVMHLGVHAFAVMNVVLAALWIYLAWRAGKLHDELAEKHPEREGEAKVA